MSRFIDLTRERFGRFTVIECVGKNKHGQFMWLCRCECGNKIIVLGNSLKNGRTKSCGCLSIEKTKQRFTKHGHCGDKIYPVWSEMRQRCTNPNHKRWKDYGGRGITVCKEWLDSPENFKKDMPGFQPGLTLERRDNELGYFPGNCYWGTRTEQARNRRGNLYVPYEGENRLLIELCEEHNMPYKTVWKRIYQLGWSVKKTLIIPVRKCKKRGK